MNLNNFISQLIKSLLIFNNDVGMDIFESRACSPKRTSVRISSQIIHPSSTSEHLLEPYQTHKLEFVLEDFSAHKMHRQHPISQHDTGWRKIIAKIHCPLFWSQ
jgi:hypothetical protein